MTDLTWAEFQLIVIIEQLRSGNPEPLITFIREDGDMTQFSAKQLNVIESVLRGENPKGRGRPKINQELRTDLLFHIAWYSMEGFPLSNPEDPEKTTAFDKASEAVNHRIGPGRAKRMWDEAEDREYFRKAVRD